MNLRKKNYCTEISFLIGLPVVDISWSTLFQHKIWNQKISLFSRLKKILCVWKLLWYTLIQIRYKLYCNMLIRRNLSTVNISVSVLIQNKIWCKNILIFTRLEKYYHVCTSYYDFIMNYSNIERNCTEISLF